MEPATRRKIEEAVMEILRKADLEAMTEFKVRVTASERLGMDLSGIEHKSFVRSVIESFLLSNDFDDQSLGKDTGLEGQGTNANHDRVICKLSNDRTVEVQGISGKTFVSFRRYYHKDGKKIPPAKGINLSAAEWSSFKKCVPAIQETVVKMTSKLRSEHDGNQSEDVSNRGAAFNPEVIPIEKFEINRFDGKNYLCWAQHIEYFLKQLEIAYVLTDPCPSVTLTPEASTTEVVQAKAAEQKWLNDDYICHRNILNSLSDNLFYQYSKKCKSAKELWEELRYVYRYEEYGARSQVKKYIEFQIDEGKAILEQINELNMVVDSIIASGMEIDDNFHVSVIISKLPPSWKDFCIKLLREEYLPFSMLMDLLMIEVELRSQNRNWVPSNLRTSHLSQVHGPSKGDVKKSIVHSKERTSELDNNAIVCYSCGRKGHVSRQCPSQKVDKDLNRKRVGGTHSTAAVPVLNVGGGVAD